MVNISSSIKNNTAIVLVPGSFTPETFYTHVSRRLISDGFSAVIQCQLLSAAPKDNQRTPPAKLEDDAFYIREVLEAYLAQGKDIVLVMNSYGGFAGTEAIKGIPTRSSLTTEIQAGQRGALVGMVYLSSFVPLAGDSLRSVMGDTLFEPLKSGDPGNYMYLPDQSGPGIFSDYAAEGKDDEVAYWFGRMLTHSSDSFDGKVSHDMWAEGAFDGKAVYILGENDLVVPPTLAESMLEKIESKVGKGKVELKRIDKGGHMMHVTRPDVVADIIEELLASMSS